MNTGVPDLILTDIDYSIFVSETQLPIKDADKQILIDLYNSTNGASWTNPWDISATATWAYNNLVSNKILINREGWITEIDLSNRNLSGVLPSSLGSLQYITSLKLHENSITGTIPDELANLPIVKTIDISRNSITSMPELGNIASLEIFNSVFNYLDFTNIEKNINISGFNYSPQKDFLEDVSVTGGASFTITFDAGGSATYYEWHNQNDIKIADGKTLVIEDATLENQQKYKCVAKNYLATQSDFSLSNSLLRGTIAL